MADEQQDVWDSWEEMADSGELEKRLEEIKPKSSKNQREDNAIIYNSSYCGGVTIIPREETHRSQFSPQVKILKRPKNHSDEPIATRLLVNGDKQSKQPMKTLEQREAEYAEARLRILGAASSDDDDKERPLKLIQQFEELKIEDNVIRQPRGPDGTKGFNIRR